MLEKSIARLAIPAHQRISDILFYIYQTLSNRYGPQHWWPAEEPFEVMVGAVLTQSCAWRNVEKAISNLREAGLLSPGALRHIDLTELALLIRPCGYYNAKARKLKSLADWLKKYGDDPEKLAALDGEYLRRELLSVHGIGEETADSMLLYATNKPVFVVDTYTRRILSRLGLAPQGSAYRDYQTLFMANLPPDAALYNEYHALLVSLAKDVCRKVPRCGDCCLKDICGLFSSK